MIPFATDEDFNNRILRGVLRRQPGLDMVRVQEVLTREERNDDRRILEWLAAEQRVLLIHDVTTMRPYAETRVAEGRPMPGVFEVSQSLSIGQAIEEILPSTARRKSLSSSACRNAHKNREIPPAKLAGGISLIQYVLWRSETVKDFRRGVL